MRTGAAVRTMIVAVLVLCAISAGARAQPTPVGLWRIFYDDTGRDRATVLIQSQGGVLTGRIVSVVDPAEAARRCERCEGARKGQPMLGLTIITGMHRVGDHWGGGQILDPQTGSLYRCTMRLADGGRKLIVRGFLGISLLGRSETWLRAR